jgi:hypothetical protein
LHRHASQACARTAQQPKNAVPTKIPKSTATEAGKIAALQNKTTKRFSAA